MKRHTLLKKLAHYFPESVVEQKHKNEIIHFITMHEQCFERTLEIGHITASAWLINKDNSKALLMHHAKLNKWVQLGGHCDGDPDVLAVAIKEAQEESGIQSIIPVHEEIFDIDVHLIPANIKEKEHYHYDIRFLLQVASDEEIVQNNESKELRWVGKSIDELPTQSVSVVRMFHKWRLLNCLHALNAQSPQRLF